MPSRPLDTGWDFGPVLDLIDSDLTIASPSNSPRSQAAVPTHHNKHTKESPSAQSLRLGDFTNLFKQLGISIDEPLPALDLPEPESEVSSSSDDAPAKKKTQKEVHNGLARRQVAEGTPPIVATPVYGTHARRIEATSKQASTQSRFNVGARIRPTTPVQLDPPMKPHKQAGHKVVHEGPIPPPNPFPVCDVPIGTSTPIQSPCMPLPPGADGYFTSPNCQPAFHGCSLVPRTVQPLVVPRTPQRVQMLPQKHTPVVSSALSNTLTIRPQIDRHEHFINHLVSNFPEDKKWLVSPKQLCTEPIVAGGIHVFVDSTNIMIGFKEMLRKCGAPSFDMSFDCLALLMERRRPVAKRVFAGSHREAAPHPHVTKLVETSKAVGYENNVKEQVFIRREESERKKFFKDVERIGWTKAAQRRSGNGSGSDSEMGPPMPTTPSAPKWVEQGVDEILHLKMCQSIIDTEVPATMVVATGDGAEAEHSDGFLAQVERALKKGWKVELVSWKQQTSGGYTNKRFRAKWGDKFRIIELDEYLESLIDTP